MIANLTDARAEASRRRQIDILGDLGPDRIARELSKLEGAAEVAHLAARAAFAPSRDAGAA